MTQNRNYSNDEHSGKTDYRKNIVRDAHTYMCNQLIRQLAGRLATTRMYMCIQPNYIAVEGRTSQPTVSCC